MVQEFNLIDEPWIPVLMVDGQIQQVGIRKFFEQANKIADIAAELSTMRFAIFRIMLAILRRSCDDVLEEDPKAGWKQLWQSEVPLAEINDYLNEVRDRFDLLDPVKPFMQTPRLRTAKGEWKNLDILIADSPGTDSLYTQTDPTLTLSYAQAAQWLIHAHAFDYSGIKSGAAGDSRVKGGKGYPMGIGWSGWLGCTMIIGANMWQTLVLNYCADFEFDDDWEKDLPIWEEEPLTSAANDMYRPYGQISLITWPQRRILLRNNGEGIDAVLVSNGDPVAYTDQLSRETMTPWRYSNPQSVKAKREIYMPKALEPEVALWRGLSSLLPESAELVKGLRKGDKVPQFIAPKTVQWIGRHIGDALPSDFILSLKVCSMAYGSQNASFEDVATDTLVFPGKLASLEDPSLRSIVLTAVGRSETAASIFANFATNVARASGCAGEAPANVNKAARARVYAQIDPLFRRWLEGLTITGVDPEDSLQTWTDQLRQLLRNEARTTANEAPPTAWAGREESIGGTDRKRQYTLGLAEAWFRSALNKELPSRKDR